MKTELLQPEQTTALSEAWALLQWYLAKNGGVVEATIALAHDPQPCHIERRDDGCLWVVSHSRGIHGFQYNGFADRRGLSVCIATSYISAMRSDYERFRSDAQGWVRANITTQSKENERHDFSIFEHRLPIYMRELEKLPVACDRIHIHEFNDGVEEIQIYFPTPNAQEGQAPLTPSALFKKLFLSPEIRDLLAVDHGIPEGEYQYEEIDQPQFNPYKATSISLYDHRTIPITQIQQFCNDMRTLLQKYPYPDDPQYNQVVISRLNDYSRKTEGGIYLQLSWLLTASPLFEPEIFGLDNNMRRLDVFDVSCNIFFQYIQDMDKWLSI